MIAQGNALGNRSTLTTAALKGRHTPHGSIPDVTFVVLDLVFLQELAKLLLEGSLSMMFPLFGDVAFEGG